MKVVTLTGVTRSAGGLYFAVSSLCKDLFHKGTDLLVLGRDDGNFESDRAIWEPVPVRSYPGYGPLGTSVKVRSILKNEAPDLVHQHGIWLDDQWASLQWQSRTKRPVIISPHGMLDQWAVKNSGWKKRIVSFLFASKSLKQANCIHALCESEAESIRAYGLKNPIAIIPNGVELPPTPIPSRIKQDAETKKLLFLGRIHPKKGIKELIQAWSQLQKRADVSWELIIAGWDDGGYSNDLIQLVESLGLSHSIKFIGPVFGQGKDELLRNVDAFILPSFSEGLPMSILEAWSYNLPVVMTDFCNLPDGFEVNAAIKIDPEMNSIAVGLGKLMSLSSAQLNELGNNGRSLVEEKFTWDIVSKKMSELYHWCLNGGDVPNFVRLK